MAKPRPTCGPRWPLPNLGGEPLTHAANPERFDDAAVKATAVVEPNVPGQLLAVGEGGRAPERFGRRPGEGRSIDHRTGGVLVDQGEELAHGRNPPVRPPGETQMAAIRGGGGEGQRLGTDGALPVQARRHVEDLLRVNLVAG